MDRWLLPLVDQLVIRCMPFGPREGHSLYIGILVLKWPSNHLGAELVGASAIPSWSCSGLVSPKRIRRAYFHGRASGATIRPICLR